MSYCILLKFSGIIFFCCVKSVGTSTKKTSDVRTKHRKLRELWFSVVGESQQTHLPTALPSQQTSSLLNWNNPSASCGAAVQSPCKTWWWQDGTNGLILPSSCWEKFQPWLCFERQWHAPKSMDSCSAGARPSPYTDYRRRWAPSSLIVPANCKFPSGHIWDPGDEEKIWTLE